MKKGIWLMVFVLIITVLANCAPAKQGTLTTQETTTNDTLTTSTTKQIDTSNKTPLIDTNTSTTLTSTQTPTLPDVELLFPEVQRITADDLKKLIDNRLDFVLVDTRANNIFAAGHIIGATNITSNILDPTVTELKLIGLPDNKLIVFYCD